MTPEQLKAVHDQIAAVVEGIINDQEEVTPQVFLVYHPKGLRLGIAIPLPADMVVDSVSSTKGKNHMTAFIGAALRGDVELPGPGTPDAIVRVFEGWTLTRKSLDEYDRERDGPIADMPDRGECAFITLHTLQGSAGGMIRIETDANGKRRALPVPFDGELTLTGAMVPDLPGKR